MKLKNITLAVVALTMLSFASCRRSFNCNCTVDGKSFVTLIEQETKGNAKDICDDMDKGGKIQDANASCVLEDYR